MNTPRNPVTAYHEAGHAVAALALGRSVHKVSVLPNQLYLGLCRFGPGSPRPTQDALEREALITLAGPVAEARHAGTFDAGGAARDLACVRRLAAGRAGDRQADRLVRRLFAKTEHLLAGDGHWQAVELIAAELLARGTISGRAARHLYEQGLARC